MPDYTPPYVIGRTVTFTASAAITGGDVVEVSGSGTVRTVVPSATPSSKVVGIAADDTVINGRVTVYGFGPIHESIADGTITAGDQLCTATNAGRQVRTQPPSSTPGTEPAVYAAASTVLDVNNARSMLGVALTSVSDGQKVRWMASFSC